MGWAKIGVFLAGVIASFGTLVTIYVSVFQEKVDVEAHLTYGVQSYPQQYFNRIQSSTELLKYNYLYEKIDSISGDTLSHNQLNDITNLSQKPYTDIFSEPFAKGLSDYRVKLFISLKNNGERPAKDVYIKLPAKGLILIEGDAKDIKVVEQKESSIEIDTLVQNGTIRVWVYFDSYYDDIFNSEINIGHNDGVAKVETFESFSGLNATVARHSYKLTVLFLFLITVIAMLISFIVIEVYGVSISIFFNKFNRNESQ